MTFVKNADTSISQSGIDDTTLANSLVFAELVGVADPRSFIDTASIGTDTNNNVRTIMLYIPKLTIAGNLNIYVPRTASLFVVINGDITFTANELANFGTMKWKGYVKDNDSLNEAAYNLVLVTGRLSSSYFKQAEAAIDLRGLSGTFEYMIIRLGSPIDAFSSTSTALNLTGVWLQSLDRSHAFTGNDGGNAYVRYKQQGIFKDVILSTPCTFFNIPDVIDNLTILSLGGNVLAGFNGIDRFGVFTKDVVLTGVAIIGDGSIQSLGSPKIYIEDSRDGTETKTTSVGDDIERQAGKHFTQRVQFEVRDLAGNPVENVVIRYKETDSGNQAPFLSYCTVRDPAVYEVYDNTTTTNHIRVFTSGPDGKTNIIKCRQGISWDNRTGNPNHSDQHPDGPILDIKTVDAQNNIQPDLHAVGYKLDMKPVQIRERGNVLLVPVTILPVVQWQHTEAEIAAFDKFETYVKIFEGIRYWEKTHTETINYTGVGNHLIDFDGKKLTLADGWDLFLTAGTGEIVVNNADKSITIPTGGTLISDDVFDELSIQGDFVHSDVTVNGLYDYLKLGVEYIKSYELAPITSFSDTIKYVIEFLRVNTDGTQTPLYTFNAPADVPTYFEVADGTTVNMYVHGGGIARISDTFTELPRLLDPTPTLDGDAALIESVTAKLDNGEYDATIIKNGNTYTLNLGGTESMANVNTGILYYLCKHGVSKYNVGKQAADRITIDDIITDYGNSLEMYAIFGSLNNLYFNSGAATSIVLNDANESLLGAHDFGINVSTATKFLATLLLLAGDTYKIDGANYVSVTVDGTVSLVLSKSDTNLAWIKRDWVELSKHTFTAIQPNYVPVVLKTFTTNPPVVTNKYTPISDYLEPVGETILHKKNLVDPANDEAATENQYHLRLMNDFDKTFPFGVSGLHVLRTVRDTQLVLNYEPVVISHETNCKEPIYYNAAGSSDGVDSKNVDTYKPYVVQNVGGNSEYFEINLHKTTGSYNDAAGLFHEAFAGSTPSTIQQFYLITASGQEVLYHAFVTAKLGSVWQMNRGLPGHAVQNGDRITYLKTAGSELTKKDLIYVAMQVAYGEFETVATGYITPLLQEAIVVTSGADIKSDLATIIQKEDQIQESISNAILTLEALWQNSDNYSERENNADGTVNFRVYTDNTKTELIRDYLITTNGDIQSRDPQ